MATIDPTQQLVAIIRQQMATTHHHGVAQRPASNAKATGGAPKKQKPAQLMELVSQRAQAIDPCDPDRNRKAFRVFLESVLLGELGMELINDPTFYRLVDEVQHIMESDAVLGSQIEEAGKLLLAPRTKQTDS